MMCRYSGVWEIWARLSGEGVITALQCLGPRCKDLKAETINCWEVPIFVSVLDAGETHSICLSIRSLYAACLVQWLQDSSSHVDSWHTCPEKESHLSLLATTLFWQWESHCYLSLSFWGPYPQEDFGEDGGECTDLRKSYWTTAMSVAVLYGP